MYKEAVGEFLTAVMTDGKTNPFIKLLIDEWQRQVSEVTAKTMYIHAKEIIDRTEASISLQIKNRPVLNL